MCAMPAKKGEQQANPSTAGDSELIRFVENLKQQWVETIDALPDPFMIVGRDYKIKKANAAIAHAADRAIKTIIGKPCFEVFAGRQTPCDNCQMTKATVGKPLDAYEIHNAQNDRWYEVISKPIKLPGSADASQNAAEHGYLQIYRDRTETRRLQNQVAHQEKLASIGQLAGGFAHEINNPLGGILVFSQMLLRELDEKGSHYQDVMEIENAAQRCKKIVEGLLDFARQRPIKHETQDTDFHNAIESAVKFAQVGHNQRNTVDIKLELQAKVFTGLSDRNRLIQVLLNLCSNAIHAMPRGGNLTVSTCNITLSSQPSIVVTIKDTGTGIKKENIKKIFDPFFTTKEPGQGTGLGLSIVHGIVQDLGGTISVDSKVGFGTTFTVTLPLGQPHKTELNDET